MAEISVVPDFLTSTLVTYHILNAPTKISRRYSAHLYRLFEDGINPMERSEYLSFLASNGIDPGQFDEMRCRIFSPKMRDLADFSTGSPLPMPDAVMGSIIAFQERFMPYWSEVERDMLDLAPGKLKLMKNNFDRIYDLALDEIPGERARRPERVEVRLVEGMSPSSHGSHSGDMFYIVEQAYNFRSNEISFNTFVHELIPHDIASKYRFVQEELFGRYDYELEEGFVKAMTNKIVGRILPSAKGELVSRFGQQGSYHLYLKNWPMLKRMQFPDWYRMCLKEIKERLTF
jgi:hypothetical protein